MNSSNNRLFSKLPWIIIGLFVFIKAFNYLMDSQFYPLKSQKVSPNGEMTIFEFNQLSDGRTHAPYGTLLSLSHSNNIHHPEEGYTFFAGYCRPLNYNWETDFKILVSCHPAERKLIKTQAILVHGVMIEVKTE